ncbi:gluconokinase [Colwellia psychrerythraea]|uniref:Gluconokinase n=1 Tax=Colwellia psychrerythraea TaxID=28229 RepID=A0A099KRL1_COLPS|nr:gluconokinase [Colwellia psychrerythraea]KGJ93116.1 carbohydrate kinase, thermoresistant glucokinase family [Colwellia psychrerythraea]
MTQLSKTRPYLFIVMGVSGTGKSSVAKHISDEFSWCYVDADDFHSPQAKKHMAENKPLTDEMRTPWLLSITEHLVLLSLQGHSVALAYSGLKSTQRNLFRELPFYCHFFSLVASKDVIAKRISQRKNHFFPLALLDSQFAAMEPPLPSEQDVSVIDIERPLELVANELTKLAKQIIRKKNNEQIF